MPTIQEVQALQIRNLEQRLRDSQQETLRMCDCLTEVEARLHRMQQARELEELKDILRAAQRIIEFAYDHSRGGRTLKEIDSLCRRTLEEIDKAL